MDLRRVGGMEVESLSNIIKLNATHAIAIQCNYGVRNSSSEQIKLCRQGRVEADFSETPNYLTVTHNNSDCGPWYVWTAFLTIL